MAWGWVKGWGHAIAGAGGAIGHGFGALLDFANITDFDDAHGSQFDKMMGGVQSMFGGVHQGLGPIGDGVSWLLKKDYEWYSDYVSRPISAGVTAASLAESHKWQEAQGRNEFTAMFDPDTWTKGAAIAKHRSPGQAVALAWGTSDILDEREVADAEKAWWFTLMSGSFDATTSIMLDPLGKAGQVMKKLRPLHSTSNLDSTLSRMAPFTKRMPAAPHVPPVPGPMPKGTLGGAIEPEIVEPPPRAPAGAIGGAETAVAPASAAGPGGLVPPSTEPGFEFGKKPGSPPPKVIPGAVERDLTKPDIGGFVENYSPMRETLDWAQRVQDANPKGAAKIIEKHPILRNNTSGGLIAGILSDTSRGDKDLIARIAMGDGSAYKELDELRPDVARRLAQLNDVRDDLIKVEAVSEETGKIRTPTEKALDAARINTVEKEIDALDSRERLIDKLIGPDDKPYPGLLGSLDQVPKSGIYTKAGIKSAETRASIDLYSQRMVSDHFFQYNPFNSGIRIVGMAAGKFNHFANERRPTGFLDTNDAEGWRELDRMLSRVKGFDPQERRNIVSSYMRETDAGSKQGVAMNAERSAIRHIAARNGINPDSMDEVIAEFSAERDRAMTVLRNRAYSATTEPGTNRRIDFFGPENDPIMVLPDLVTQTAEKIPLADMDVVQRAVGRSKNHLKATLGKVRDPLISSTDMLSSWWKITNFMRLGYMVRTISDDEAAYMAKLGAMTTLSQAGAGAKNLGMNIAGSTRMRAGRVVYRTKDGTAYVARRKKRAWNELPENLQGYNKRRLGEKEFDIPLSEPGEAAHVQGMFPKGKVGDYWRGRLDENDRTLQELDEDRRLRSMRQEMAQGLVNKGDLNYHDAWMNALNRQLGQDALARKLLAGDSVESVIKWLRRDPAGRAHARELPFRAADPDRWVHNIDAFIDHYAPTKELREAALEGKATRKLLQSQEDEFQPMQVHGALLNYNMGKGAHVGAMMSFRKNFFKFMNQMPTDVMVRHPLANALYRDRVSSLVKRFEASGGPVTNEVLEKLENQARLYASKEINTVVLDLTTHSNAAHVFRFVAPFYNAWDRALKRWGRLIYGDPSILFKGNRLWQGMNSIPMAIDSQGDVETSAGDVVKGFTGLANADDQLLTFRLPAPIAKKLGIHDLNQIQIPKSSLNIVLQGDPWYLPSFGPMVQIPVSKFVESKPQYADMMKTILPYGPQSATDLIKPSSARKLGQYQNEDDQAFAKMQINLWRVRYSQWLEGGRKGPEPSPFDESITKDAKRMFALSFVSQLTMPVNVRFTSPYKFYLDQYHKLIANPQVGPEKAREAFIQQYPDFFAFAYSMSKNNAGLPATMNAWDASKKYKSSLAKAPDVASAILGPEIYGGKFNPAVYRLQFDQRLSPASSETVRSQQSPEEFQKEAIAGEGWREYMKVMNQLRVELSNRGLQSFQQRGAEDLNYYKQQFTEKIGDKYPLWKEDFDSFDGAKTQNVVSQLESLVHDPEMKNRTDIQQLGMYFANRNAALAELQRRKDSGGSGNIQAKVNQDLYSVWQYQRDAIDDSHTVFSENIFHRYLSHDDRLVAQ